MQQKRFKDEPFIGNSGFDIVYKGMIGKNHVIFVKRLDPTGVQVEKKSLMKVFKFSILSHSNLVNMIGYCLEGNQSLLVYEYMALGSLESHLYDGFHDEEPLDWNTKMVIICVAAKRLPYLHDEAKPIVIYRDLKLPTYYWMKISIKNFLI